MPFQSKAQQRYLFAKHPDIAKRFAAETPPGAYKHLPDHKKPSEHLIHHLKKKRGSH